MDGRLLAVGDDERQVTVFDATTPRQTKIIHIFRVRKSVNAVAFSPCVGDDGTGTGIDALYDDGYGMDKSNVAANTASLLEKADAAKITEVIEMKYDEIVEHLQV